MSLGKVPAPQRRRLGVIAAIATFGGLLFGYDTGVINGAERPLQAELALSNLQLGLVISALAFAAAIGALVCGKIADRWGRRRTIIALAVLFFCGTVLVVAAPGGATYGSFSGPGFVALLVGRSLLGCAVGGVSVVVPVYLAELAPYQLRGSYTGRNELMIVIGQLLAFVMNALVAAVLGLSTPGLWRVMFAVSALPAVVLFCGMLRLPESPRWLVAAGRPQEALLVLETVREKQAAAAELQEMLAVQRAAAQRVAAQRAAVQPAAVGVWAKLRQRRVLGLLFLAAGLGVAQQFTGVNAIMYYGQRLLAESGFTPQMLGWVNIAPGVISVVAGVVALRYMDRIDRRTNFRYGYGITAVTQLIIAAVMLLLLPQPSLLRGWIFLALVLVMIGAIQLFLNLATWVYLAEIFPQRLRGLGMGIAVFMLWIANATLALLVPTLVAAWAMGVFLVFAGCNAVAWLFVSRFVVETRGRTLEQLQE